MSEPFTLLIVEDDANTLALMRTALKAPNIQSYVASSGSEALQLAREILPDLIIMDLLLPRSDLKGSDIVTILKRDPATRRIPIIAVSAGGYEVIREAMAAGSDGYLTKPFPVKELRDIVHRYLQQALS